MSVARSTDQTSLESIGEVLRRYWGFDSFRPLQREAIAAALEGRDSLVVLPTGGGKSLCYQLPPLLARRTDIVVSPLISLMKDQVDGLRSIGYPAAAIHSGMTPQERREVETGLAAKKYALVFVAPERLLTPSFLRLVERAEVRAFAIDEAHCVSHWGHDFRPEYRQLSALKDRFPKASMHAYTATATRRVQDDIVEQLRLTRADMLVGQFDRPNLVYRVLPKRGEYEQIKEVVARHKNEAVIVYCISRRDTEEMASYLKADGAKAEAYHAGMSPDARRRIQDAFSQEKLDVVVATVAFGMGIDRSNVRCVAHTAMPKSIEHYQQETGRAGRDGLEAECVLLYSHADAQRWESLVTKSADEAKSPPHVLEAALERLAEMRRFGAGMRCRHRALSEYFGQGYDRDNCGACDVCLNETPDTFEATETAQKILSCVARVQERFGVGHVVDVLLGADSERIRQFGHDKLSTYKLFDGTDKRTLTQWVHQLVEQGLAVRTTGDRPILQLNDVSWEVMRGERKVRLREVRAKRVRRARVDRESWEGVDEALFERLRRLRRELAEQRRVPPYVIFGDATLRELAALKPTTRQELRGVYGVGERKLADVGAAFLSEIVSYVQAHPHAARPRSARLKNSGTPSQASPKKMSKQKQQAFELFSRGRPVEEVAAHTGRAASTVAEYLAEYIQTKRPRNIDSWVSPEAYRLVAAAAEKVGNERLRPIYEHLGEKVPYEVIRLVVSHRAAMRAQR